MIKYIAILRGINVGGRRKILMKDLRELFQDLGFKEVSTYIQSGNVFFYSKKQDKNKIADQIEKAIAKKYDFEVPVIIRTIEEIANAITTNPFYEEDSSEIERLHLTFLKNTPSEDALQAIQTIDHSPDKFKIIGLHVFIYCEGKYHTSKLTNAFFEKKLKVSTTTRNWKTVLKLMKN